MSEPAKTLRMMCPNLACQIILAVPVEARGKLVRCRGCQMTIRVPTGRPKPGNAPSAPEAGREAPGTSSRGNAPGPRS